MTQVGQARESSIAHLEKVHLTPRALAFGWHGARDSGTNRTFERL